MPDGDAPAVTVGAGDLAHRLEGAVDDDVNRVVCIPDRL